MRPVGLVFQVQRDEFHGFPPIEHGVGKKPFYHQSQAPESDSRHQRQPYDNSAKNYRIEQKVRQIVFLRNVRVFVPGDIGVVADR